MAGGAGAGKSTFVKQIRPDLKSNNWIELNADKYIEDKDSPMYNNLGKASSYIEKQELPQTINKGQNFLYDTTGTNVNNIKNIVDSGYNTMMVMVYTSPIVSFLRNFKRERKVPTVGVLTSWNNVYKNLSTYKQMFGDNFFLVETGLTPEEAKMVEKFKQAYNSGELKQFFESLLKTGEYKSTFRADPAKQKTPEEIAKSKALVDKQIEILSSQFEDIESQVKSLSTPDISNVVSKVKSFIKS